MGHLTTDRFWAALVSHRWLGRYAGLPFLPYLASAVLIAAATAAASISPHFEILFLAAVVLNAVVWGRWPSLFSVGLSVLALDFFFFPPLYSLAIGNIEDVVDLVVFSLLALLCSSLAASVRKHAIRAAEREEMTGRLYAFSRRLAGIVESHELFSVIVDHLGAVLKRPVTLLLPSGDRFAVVAATKGARPLASGDLMVIEKLWRALPSAGGSETELPSYWHVRVLRSARGHVAVLAMAQQDGNSWIDAEPGYLQSLFDQAAIAIERSQLAKAYEDARVKANTESLREALINSISHDLQTPLASILGSATALQKFESLYDPAGRAQLIANIREGAERLNHIIENIVDLSRIRAGELNPRPELVELADIINAALARSRNRLADHQLTVDVPADLPMLRLDLFLMEHALVNIIENAAKYAPKGAWIDVRASVRGVEVVLEISDPGIGIAPRDLPRIFDRFYRAEASDSRPAGVGLGLTICRAFIEANEGRIEAFSAGVGQGATFRITLPVPATALPLETVAQDE